MWQHMYHNTYTHAPHHNVVSEQKKNDTCDAARRGDENDIRVSNNDTQKHSFQCKIPNETRIYSNNTYNNNTKARTK